MARKTEYLLIALVGVVMICVAAFVQFVSMDLQAHPFGDYVSHDLISPTWWRGVGAPCLLGLVYLCTAVYALWAERGREGAGRIVSACFALAVLFAFFSSLGIFAAVVLGIALALSFARPYEGSESPPVQ